VSRRRSSRIQADPQTAVVRDLTHEGNGVLTDVETGKTVFVHGALPGETVEYQRTKKQKNYDEAQLLKVITASPDRVTPECPHFEICGGCSLQHLAAEKQIEFKQQMLLDNYERVGKVEPGEVVAPLTGPLWNYRTKARLGVKDVLGKGRVLVGFRERAAPYLADMHECHILAGGVGQLLDPLSDLIGELSIKQRLPQIEVAVGDDEVALVFRVLQPPSDEDRELMLAFGREHKLAIWLQPKGPNTAEPIDGSSETLSYALADHDAVLNFRPTDFTQINPPINKAMIAQALDWLELAAEHRVLELFAGLGNFTLPLARRVAEVVTVEGEETLVARADANAQAQGFDNIRTRVANLYTELDVPPWGQGQFDRVLLDPPRSGAREVLALVAAAGAERIVYVSCHPGSLARDAGILVNELGYRLERTGVMDMFPHTAHVESMALFVKV